VELEAVEVGNCGLEVSFSCRGGRGGGGEVLVALWRSKEGGRWCMSRERGREVVMVAWRSRGMILGDGGTVE
jgi:hypothetical protein